MSKPRLTAPVMRGLFDMAMEFSGGDLIGLREDGVIDSVKDVERAVEWVREMNAYRNSLRPCCERNFERDEAWEARP